MMNDWRLKIEDTVNDEWLKFEDIRRWMMNDEKIEDKWWMMHDE